MPTVKDLLREIDDLKMREQIWLGIRDWLEGFLPEGGSSKIEINGVRIPEEIVIDVLGDVDSNCLGPIQERIRGIESSRVDDGKDKKDKKPKVASKKSSAKRSKPKT